MLTPLSCVGAGVLALVLAWPLSADAQAPIFGPGTDTRTPQRLSVAVSVDQASVTPGRLATLRFDMAPVSGIHVYAPGNPDYIPVSITLTAPRGVQVRPAVYPPAEDYRFGELQEVVKVYSRPFQIRQPMVLPASAVTPGATSVTVAGTVRYQACTDKVCFPPQAAAIEIALPLATGKGRPR